MMTKNKTMLYGSMVAMQAVIYALGNAITKIAYESITPFWGMFFRFALAFALFMILFGKNIILELKVSSLMTWLPSSLCVSATYIFCNLSLAMTTATNAGFLISLSILFVPFFEAVIMNRKYKLKYLPAQALVIVGLYLLCSNGGSFSFGPGELLGLLSSVAMAGALVFGEKGLENMNVMTISTAQIGLTVILSLVGAVILEPNFQITAVQPSAWMILLYLSIASTCLAFWLQNKALTALPSTQVSLILCSEPVFTAACSWLLLGEVLSSIGFAGTVIIIGCIFAETYMLSNDEADCVLQAECIPSQEI